MQCVRRHRSPTSGTRRTSPAARTAPTRCRPASRTRSTPTSPSSRSGSASAGRRRSRRALGVHHGRRQAAGAGQVVHPGHQRGLPADDGRGLRDVRRARRRTATRSRSSRSTDPSGNRLPVPAADCQQVLDAEHRRRHERAAAGRHDQRHRRPGRDRAPGGRQDRHHRQPLPGLVRRLHPRARDGGVGRQPQPAQGRLPAEQRHDRRRLLRRRLRWLPARADLEADDERHAGRTPRSARSPRRATTSATATPSPVPVGDRQVGRRGQGAAAGGRASTRSSAATRSTSSYARPARSPTPTRARDASVYPGQRVDDLRERRCRRRHRRPRCRAAAAGGRRRRPRSGSPVAGDDLRQLAAGPAAG